MDSEYQRVITRLVLGLLATGCLLSMNAFAQDDPSTVAQTADDEVPMVMNNPGSIVERLEEDEEPKDHLVEFPSDATFKSWYDFKDNLDKKHGLNFGIS